MNSTSSIYSVLYNKYPYSHELLDTFIPLLSAQNTIRDIPSSFSFEKLDPLSFSQGKAFALAIKDNKLQYLDKKVQEQGLPLLKDALIQSFPAVKKELEQLFSQLGKEETIVENLLLAYFLNDEKSLKKTAKEHKIPVDVVLIFASSFTHALAKRAAHSVKKEQLKEWSHGYCPFCGSPAQGAYLHGEGQRRLVCSMCSFEWDFPRTRCHSCSESNPSQQEFFYFEKHNEEQAVCCKTCKKYILTVDLRSLSSEIPIELYFLCLAPLDALVQEKGYASPL